MERYGESEKRMRSGVKHGFTKEVRRLGERKSASFQGVVFQGELETRSLARRAAILLQTLPGWSSSPLEKNKAPQQEEMHRN